MEGLKKRAWILGGILVAWGAMLQFAPAIPRTAVQKIMLATGVAKQDEIVPIVVHDEKWMEDNAPTSVGDFHFMVGNEGPSVSYKMDKGTYDTLRPWGIVARRFSNNKQAYDVVLIAGDSKDSFHDPRVCFTAQKFNILEEGTAMIHTKTRGEVPVTLANMTTPEGGKSLTVFFYKGPGGFFPTTQKLKLAMFTHQFKTLSDAEGVFYRFIPMHTGATKEELTSFIADYLDKSGQQSKGFF